MDATPEPLSAADADAALPQLLPAIEDLLRPVQDRFGKILLALEGANRGSLEANQNLAEVIQETADRLAVALRCPKCEQPGRLRCVKAGNTTTGTFSFYHVGKTHGGTSTLPRLVLTEKGPDGRRTRTS